MHENRRARRILLNQPAVIEVVGQPAVELPASVARVYSRVECDRTAIGKRFPGVLRDLSTNGAFIATDPVPLLSRVALHFDFDGTRVDGLAWVLWRREADAELHGPEGLIHLPRGVGLLFESIPLDIRVAIARAVDR